MAIGKQYALTDAAELRQEIRIQIAQGVVEALEQDKIPTSTCAPFDPAYRISYDWYRE